MKAMVKHGQQQPRKKKEKKVSPKKSPRKRLKRAAHINISGSPPARLTAAKSKAKNKPVDPIDEPETFPDTIPYGNQDDDEVNATDLEGSQQQAVQPDRQRFDDEHSD